MGSGEAPQYWFNIKTGEVETGPLSLALDRIGPFSSEAEAMRALDILRERAAQIRREDDLDWRDR